MRCPSSCILRDKFACGCLSLADLTSDVISDACHWQQAVESAKDPELKARNQRLIASWQAALPSLFPAIKVSLDLHKIQAFPEDLLA